MTNKDTLQNELKIMEGLIRVYQMMLGAEEQEDFENIDKMYINNKSNTKSPESLGKIDSKNRNKLERVMIHNLVSKSIIGHKRYPM